MSRPDAEEVFARLTEPLAWSECLLWMGAINWARDGYGQMSVGDMKMGPHRYAWEREYGPIPDGKQVDHTCHVRTCVEISHLRLATARQNQENRAGARAGSGTGIRGVRARGDRFYALVNSGGQAFWQGIFPTLDEAEFYAVVGRARLHDRHSAADLAYLNAHGLTIDDCRSEIELLVGSAA